MMAKGKVWKIKEVSQMNVHFFHKMLGMKIDKQKLKSQLMRGKNGKVTQL